MSRLDRALAQLSGHGSVEVLDLKGADLGDREAELLGQALEQGSALLVELDLAQNRIGDPGALCLARALGSHKTLAKVDLRENCLGEVGAEALLEALQSNPSVLMEVKLEHNAAVSEDSAKRVRQAATKNRVIRNLRKYLGREPMDIEKEIVWKEVAASFNGAF
jgi:Ran GTPase-activating protein (RanGAP) involved in mRNA processing and transport